MDYPKDKEKQTNFFFFMKIFIINTLMSEHSVKCFSEKYGYQYLCQFLTIYSNTEMSQMLVVQGSFSKLVVL